MAKKHKKSYHEIISEQIHCSEDFFESLIKHNNSNGIYKEQILKNIIRTRIPKIIEVASGFIKFKDEENSSQIDILLYDSRYPTLFKEGDLVVVTPEAVRGIIEVKSTATQDELHEALVRLGNNIEKLDNALKQEANYQRPFVGFFSFSNEIKEIKKVKQSIAYGVLGLEPKDISPNKKKEMKKTGKKEILKGTEREEYMAKNAIKILRNRSITGEENKLKLENRIVDYICISDVTEKKSKENNEFNELYVEYNYGTWTMHEMDSNIEEAIFISNLIMKLSPKEFMNNSYFFKELKLDNGKDKLELSEIVSILEGINSEDRDILDEFKALLNIEDKK